MHKKVLDYILIGVLLVFGYKWWTRAGFGLVNVPDVTAQGNNLVVSPIPSLMLIPPGGEPTSLRHGSQGF